MAEKKNDKDECVRVIVRCRPFNSKEKKEGNGRAVHVHPKDHTVEVVDCDNPKLAPKRWTFDATFDENCTQRDIYDSAAAAIIDDVLEGFNGTIFAYGQTGAGKSFTMEGMKEWRAVNKPELRGIIPNAMEHIFERVSADSGDETTFLIRCSYLEIYNEEVRDLLAKGKRKGKLDIKQHPDKGVYVDGLTEVKCSSVGELEEAQERGNKQRSVGATLMNAGSSRSHSVFCVIIERSDIGPDGEPHIRAGKLNLVDLAGSERSSKTGATGDRMKEGIMINKSLSALGNVISALTDAKATHIPYRDSKLTRLLQDSLGGNTKTMMCANCGPADYNTEETISTLRYADRAKQIKNKPKINEDPKDAALREMQEEIKKLRELLASGGDITPEMMAKLNMGGHSKKTKKKEQKIKRGPRVETKIIKQIDEVIVEQEEIVMDGLTEEEMSQKKKEMQEEREKRRLATERALKKKSREMKMSDLESTKMEGELHETLTAAEEAEKAKDVLMRRLKEMQSQMIAGQQLQAKAKKQEADLRRAQIAKVEKERLAAQKEREVKAQEEQMEMLNTSFTSLEEEVRIKAEKLDKLRERYLMAKEEIKDMEEEYRRERDDLWMAVRDLGRQIKLKELIIKSFMSEKMIKELHAKAVWDDDIGDWIVGTDTTIDLYSYKRPSASVVSDNITTLDTFPMTAFCQPESDFRAGQSVFAKPGQNQNAIGDTSYTGDHFEEKDGQQVLTWTTDVVRTANAVQLEMDPHSRTTADYSEHHKQRQAKSALEMALGAGEDSDD